MCDPSNEFPMEDKSMTLSFSATHLPEKFDHDEVEAAGKKFFAGMKQTKGDLMILTDGDTLVIAASGSKADRVGRMANNMLRERIDTSPATREAKQKAAFKVLEEAKADADADAVAAE